MSDDRIPMPAIRDTIVLADLKAELLSDNTRFSSGHLIMSVTRADFKDKETGKMLGSVSGSIAAPALGVNIDLGNGNFRLWQISPSDVFKTVLEADQKYQKALEKKNVKAKTKTRTKTKT